jgi:hypothetical protein
MADVEHRNRQAREQSSNLILKFIQIQSLDDTRLFVWNLCKS